MPNISTPLTNADLINIQYKIKKVIDALVKQTPLYSNTYKEAIPAQGGTTARIWKNVEIIPNMTAGVPGTPIIPKPMLDTYVDIPTYLYSDAIALSRTFVNQAHVNVDEMSLSQIRQMAEYVIENLIAQSIDSTCNVDLVNQFGANGKLVSNVTSTDTANAVDLQTIWTKLDVNGVKKYDQGEYKFFVHSAQRFSLLSETTLNSITDISKYNALAWRDIKPNDAKPMEMNGYVTTYKGFQIYSSPLMTAGNFGSGGQRVFFAYAWGDQSMATVTLDLESAEDFLIEIDSQSTSDPTREVAKTLAYRFMFGSQPLSDDFVTATKQRVVRYASASSSLF